MAAGIHGAASQSKRLRQPYSDGYAAGRVPTLGSCPIAVRAAATFARVRTAALAAVSSVTGRLTVESSSSRWTSIPPAHRHARPNCAGRARPRPAQSSRLHRRHQRILGSLSDAEDVLQETFVRVVARRHLQPDRSPATWLARIARKSRHRPSARPPRPSEVRDRTGVQAADDAPRSGNQSRATHPRRCWRGARRPARCGRRWPPSRPRKRTSSKRRSSRATPRANSRPGSACRWAR